MMALVAVSSPDHSPCKAYVTALACSCLVLLLDWRGSRSARIGLGQSVATECPRVCGIAAGLPRTCRYQSQAARACTRLWPVYSSLEAAFTRIGNPVLLKDDWPSARRPRSYQVRLRSAVLFRRLWLSPDREPLRSLCARTSASDCSCSSCGRACSSSCCIHHLAVVYRSNLASPL